VRGGSGGWADGVELSQTAGDWSPDDVLGSGTNPLNTRYGQQVVWSRSLDHPFLSSVRGLVRRLLVVCGTCCVAGLAVSPVMAMGDGSSLAEGTDASSSLGRALVTSGSPNEGEETLAEHEAKLDSPEAVSRRAESRTKFEGLDPEQAAKVAGEAFSALVNEPGGGPPKLPAGESIVGFPADTAAQVDLTEGKHGVIESMAPMAVETSPGQRTPVDLSLNDVGNAFEPKTPIVGVRIHKQLGEGVEMLSSGVSLTPVTEQGSALGGSDGALSGATVFYANTQTNTDTFAKATTGGFELDSLLRSVASPEVLYFKVGMPSGASLVSNAAPGGVSVVLDGQTIAVIGLPTAHDAEGTSVPVRMSVSGSTLVLTVPHSSKEYDYPIDVDPQAYDETLKLPSSEPGDTETNWRYHEEPAGKFKAPYSTGSGYVMSTQGSIGEGEHDEFRYGAHGQASIGFIEEESTASAEEASGAITKIEFVHESTIEKQLTLAGAGQSYSKVKEGFGDLWNESEKHYRGYNNENLVRIMQTATKSAAEGYGFWFELNNNAWVGINQEKGPEVSFNTSSSNISDFQNALYSSEGWLGEYNGAVEIIAKDPGLGVSDVKVKDLTAGPHGEHWEFNDPVYAEHLCTGVWCAETFTSNTANGMYFTYNKEMAEGANTFELCAEDEALIKTCTDAMAKVDDTPPSNIKLKGIAESGAELNATPHQLTLEATDAMSGIKSIAVSVDGRELGSPAGSCSVAGCTASRAVTIDGESLGAGEHRLKVAALDNADNEALKEYAFAIRNATPVHIGPGKVDPVTGQFALTASDADIAGAGGVSRSYESRLPAASLESPLGLQWNLNSGTGQRLKLLPDGSAELVGSGGEPTTFARKEGGGFEAPKGDGNLTLEAKEKEAGKGITEYLLKEPTAGSTMIFTRPQESGYVIPQYFRNAGPSSFIGYVDHIAVDSKGDVWGTANGSIRELNSSGEFMMAFGFGVKDGKNELETCTTSCKSGLQGGQIGEISSTEALAVDTKGNIWAVDGDNRIEEYNEKGGFVGQFAEATYAGREEGKNEVFHAKGIAVGANGLIWVADTGNNRVDEFNEKREFVAAFGFGVLDGSNKFEVCTTTCERGRSGSEPGQFSEPEGIAVHNGFVWIADTRNNRVEKFNEKYEYLGAFGSGGSGNGQFAYPRHIAADNRGDLWVADGEHGRIEEFSEAGTYIGQFGETGTEEERLSWVDFWLGGGGVAVDGAGDVWVPTITGIKEWAHSTWLPIRTENAAPGDTRAMSYRSVMVEGQTITEPIEQLGPVPAGVSCGKNPAEGTQAELSARLGELKAGCRALSFTYAEKTTATSEAPSGWGEYNGRLASVSLTAYSTAAKAMQTTAVAQYAYDNQGRLRAEWDPRISPALKTSYGYDSGGHLTALTLPGEQPWALTYGTTPSDGSSGRLLKVTRAQPKAGASEEEVKAKLKEQAEQPVKTETPKLSGTAVVGVKMGTSTGLWSKSPVVYAYQWEDCNSEEKECTPILGATNENYTVASSDVGHKLMAVVTATNGGGSGSVSTMASSVVSSSGTKTEGTQYGPQAGSTVEYRVPLSGGGAPHEMTSTEMAKWDQKSDLPVEATAIFPPDEPMGWPASDYKRASIGYLDAEAREVDAALPSGGIATVEFNSLNEVTRTLSADNRATALKEASKSAEVAEHLSSGNLYNGETPAEKEQEEREVSEKKKAAPEPGARLLETYGPEHKVRLANGKEEETRDHKKLSYNEGAPAGEEHNLVTKTVEWAEALDKEILSKRETLTSYKGQENLGWKLRKPTSTTIEPAGSDLTSATVYEKNTGNVVEAKAPGGTSEAVYPPSFSARFGSSGSGNGQFKQPWGVTLDSSENVWAVDSGNDRVEKFSSSGSFIGAYGKEGTGASEFEEPAGITVNQSTHNVYVADKENNRIEELNSSGGFVETIGWGVSDGKSELEVCKASCKAGISGSANGQFNSPGAVAIDSHGELLIADEGNNRIEVLSEAGAYISQFGSKGSGNGQFSEPVGVVISEGSLYVADEGNDRIQQFSLSGSYIGQFGSKGSGSGQMDEPNCITANPSTGTLYVCDYGNERMEEFSPAGKFLTEWGTWGSTHPQSFPADAAVGATGKLYIIDPWADEVGTWIPPEAGAAHLNYSTQFGSKGTGNGQFTEPTDTAVDGKGNLWSTDSADNRIEELSSQGSFIAAYGKYGSGEAQFNRPTGIAINKSTGNTYVADTGNNRIEELSSTGAYIASFGTSGLGTLKGPTGVAIDTAGDVWIADCGNNRIVEFSSTGTYIAAYGKEGAGEAQFKSPVALAFSGENVYVADSANHRVEELTNKGAYVRAIGFEGDGSGEFWTPEGITTDAAGNLYVVDNNADHVEEFSPNGAYKATFASSGGNEGQLTHPGGDAIDPAGDLYIVDSGDNRIERWDNNNQTAHDTTTIYYTAKEEAAVATCRNHPEWAGLVCQTEPVAQPGQSGPPPLPLTTTTYNTWEEPETVTEKIGSITRTTTKKYDGAGRELSGEETSTSSEDTALPAVTDEYSTETGALVKLTSTIESKARTITNVYNTLGQLASYTDAEGSTTKYSYDVDGRVEEISEPKGKQIYAYDSTTGLLTKLLDSAAGTFTATYDIEGNMLTEGYPNGMAAKYTYNPIGQATNLEYEKTSHCTEKCVWFSDAEAFAPKGELASQASTLSSENYSYDTLGRLSEVQETPTGEYCKTRVYAYDEESNRTKLTTREPNSKKECATEGGTEEKHTYDAVGRLLDPEVAYDALGNMTKIPAPDAGGSAITSSFYVDNQAAVQEQNEKSISYTYDPAGRTMIAKTKTKSGTSATISHYAGPGNALTWSCEETGECKEEKETKWTRNIPGIDGALDAIQTNGGTTLLQLHDLQGNIIATAADNETETKLLTTHNTTEFGVPIGTAPKYSWLGADGAESELGTGVISEAGATYVPQLARTLQTEQVSPPGAAPNGVMDTEAYSPPELGWANQSGDEGAANTVAEQRALEVVAGTSADPWGLLTGEEAEEFAAEFTGWANDVENFLQNAEHCDAECEEGGAADIKSDRWMAQGLEECHHQVHNPNHIKYDGKSYEQTKVCLLHLNYNTNYSNWVFAKTDSQLFVCNSLPFDGDGPSPWGDHGSQEWLCDVEGKEQWWVFGNNRGWWRQIL
jgi:YD repeat-containing protein